MEFRLYPSCGLGFNSVYVLEFASLDEAHHFVRDYTSTRGYTDVVASYRIDRWIITGNRLGASYILASENGPGINSA